MKDTIYIFGHKSPDTDSIASAIVYAHFKNKLEKDEYIPAILGEPNRESIFVLEYFGVEIPQILTNGEGKKVILVDHNDSTQSIDNIEKAEILEVVDHHRIGNFQTAYPLYVHVEPLGCTCTILYKKFMENGITIDEEMAGLMLSAILSDTLLLSSPTCTKEDVLAARMLSRIAEIDDYEDFGKEMLIAGSSLEGYSAERVANMDKKQFTFGKITGIVSQVQTYDTEDVFDIREDIIEILNNELEAINGTLAIFMLTNLGDNASTLFITGEDSKIAYKAFGREEYKIGRDIYLEGVVSRKKQIVPFLTEAALNE